MTTRIALSGNSPMWRRGMADALSETGLAVAVVEDLSDWQPGRDGSALVMGMLDEESLDVLELFSAEHPHIPVVAVVLELTLTTLAETIRWGATTAVDDHWSPTTLAQAIHGAMEGMSLVPGGIAASMAQLVPDEAGLASLVSEEETEWLRSMAGGVTVADLAEEAGYSERAMFRHLKNLYLRLGVKNRTEALLWASRNSLLFESPPAE